MSILNKENIQRWKPTSLLDTIDEEDYDIVIFAFEYISSKLVEESNVDQQLINFALPTIVLIYNKNPNIIRDIPVIIIWKKMKEVFNQNVVPTEESWWTVDVEIKYTKIFAENVYDKLASEFKINQK